MEIWRRIIIALGILIEIMSAAEVIYLIIITPYYDLIAVLFFIVPLLGFIVGGLIIYFSRYLVIGQENDSVRNARVTHEESDKY